MTVPAPRTRRTKGVTETAEILGLSYQGVLGLIRTERLRAIWMGNKYLVPDVAIAEFLGEPVPVPRDRPRPPAEKPS